MYTNGTLKPSFASQLSEQVSNPQHVNILTKHGARWVPMRHRHDKLQPFPWDGSAIRFTRLAAEMMLEELKKFGQEVRLEEAL